MKTEKELREEFIRKFYNCRVQDVVNEIEDFFLFHRQAELDELVGRLEKLEFRQRAPNELLSDWAERHIGFTQGILKAIEIIKGIR